MEPVIIVALFAFAIAVAWLAWEVRTFHADALPVIALADSPTMRALSGLGGTR